MKKILILLLISTPVFSNETITIGIDSGLHQFEIINDFYVKIKGRKKVEELCKNKNYSDIKSISYGEFQHLNTVTGKKTLTNVTAYCYNKKES